MSDVPLLKKVSKAGSINIILETDVLDALRKFQDKIIREIKFNEKWENKHEIIIFNQFLDYFNKVFGVLDSQEVKK